MTTVVTGASGFLGGVLIRALLAEGREVRAVDLRPGPTLDDLDVEFAQANVLDRSALETAFRGAGTVFHVAAMISVSGDPTGLVWDVNVNGARNAAEIALVTGVDRFVHCSSVHAYDLEVDAELTETSPRSVSPALPVYDRSKAAGEAAVREVVERGLDAVIVNPTGILGPYDFAPSRMGLVLLALFRRRLPALISGGFNWVDARDVAASMLLAEAGGRTGENYLLPGHHRSLTEIASVAARVSGVREPRIAIPMGIARMLGPVGDAINRRSAKSLSYTSEALHALRFSPPVSGAKARYDLGHHSRPFDETIGDTYRWFDESGFLDDSLPRDS